jgi:hypothetical protein
MLTEDAMYYFDLAKAFIYAVGGPAAIIIGLSTFFGNWLSKQKLADSEAKHKTELEEKKAELDKAKSQFFRYSEKQFDLYNDLWRVLMRTKIAADELWREAKPEKLPGFAEQISLTRKAVMDNMLLIEEEHFNNLEQLLEKFENFEFGKQKLVEIRSGSSSTPIVDADQVAVESAISSNKAVKEEYTILIMEIGQSFREQIRG